MKDYFIEIQAFCVGYMKLKGITDLYRLASNEAQKQIALNQQVGAVPHYWDEPQPSRVRFDQQKINQVGQPHVRQGEGHFAWV